jgi:hypothetical protein
MPGVSLKHISLWIYIYIFCIIDNFFNIWHMNGKIGDKILDETNFLLTLLRQNVYTWKHVNFEINLTLLHIICKRQAKQYGKKCLHMKTC